MNSFAIIFQIILLRFKVFAFHVQNSKGACYVGHVSVAASEQELKWNIYLFMFRKKVFV